MTLSSLKKKRTAIEVVVWLLAVIHGERHVGYAGFYWPPLAQEEIQAKALWMLLLRPEVQLPAPECIHEKFLSLETQTLIEGYVNHWRLPA